jgi:hypothetical protein
MSNRRLISADDKGVDLVDGSAFVIASRCESGRRLKSRWSHPSNGRSVAAPLIDRGKAIESIGARQISAAR